MPKILVIDDSGLVRSWIRRVLAEAGYEVLVAGNGKEGLQTLRQAPVDAVITDIYMPEQDGFEVLREIRGARSGVKCIAITARASDLNMFRVASALGASATLQKPFPAELLLETVARVLES